MHRLLLPILLLLLAARCQSSQESGSLLTPGEDYLAQRNQLLHDDSLMAFDAKIQLTEQELELNRKYLNLKDSMIRGYLAQSYFPPSRNFYHSKSHIEQTKLFDFFRLMPKGGILHLHSSALCDARWIVNRAVQEPNCYVYWEDDNQDYIKGQLEFFNPGEVPDGFQSTQLLNANNPGFQDELVDLLTFDQDMGRDSVDIWTEFEHVFRRLNRFTYFHSIYKDYHRAAFDSLWADGVHHVEIRARLDGGLYDLDHSDDYYNSDSLVVYLQEVMMDMQNDHPNFTLKLVYTALRFHSKERIQSQMIKALELRQRYPDFVVGFDLVANEDDGNTTLFFLDIWMKLDSMENAYGVDLPLYLHNGETDRYSLKNLYDAALLKSKRIGHGFNLNHYPVLQELVKDQDICIEICPLSNQILGYVSDLRIHPGSYFLRNGIQVAISSDDPGIFGYNGLSYDFWSIALAWELDLQALKKLAMNSIEYSSLNPEEKEKALEYWNERWGIFVKEGSELLEQ